MDILVNCAGRTKRTPTLEVTEEEWNSILDTNLTGTLRACQVFGRHMLERGSGRIVNIASLASFVGLFEVAAYTASKAGGGRPHQVAGRRVGPARRERERDRARRLPHRAQHDAARRHRARPRVPDPHAPEALRASRRAGGRVRLSRLRRRELRERRSV